MIWIKKIRKDNKLTQDEFADKLNFSRTLISKWENGQRQPSADQIKYICNTMQIDINKYIMVDGFLELINKKKKAIYFNILITVILLTIALFIIIYGLISITNISENIDKYIWSISFIFCGITIYSSIVAINVLFKTVKDKTKLKILLLKQYLSKEKLNKINWTDSSQINLEINNLVNQISK